MNCPECGSADIRVSRHWHAMDVVERLLGRRACRCRECHQRFYARKSRALQAAASDQKDRFQRRSSWHASSQQSRKQRRLGLLAVLALAFIVFLIFLLYLTTEQNQSDETRASFLPACHLVQPA